MKKFILLLALIPSVFQANSQKVDSLISTRNYVYFHYNQEKSFKEIKNILKNNPASSAEFQRYHNNTVGGATCAILGAVGLTAGIITISNNFDLNISFSNSSTSQESSGQKGTGLFIVGFGLEITGIALLATRNKHLQKSINFYNSRNKHTSYFPVQ